MPIESDNNDANESPQYIMRKTEENEPVKTASTATPKPDSALKKGALGLEKFVFRLLSGLMLVAGIALLWKALAIAGFMSDLGHTQNPLLGFGSIIGIFFALSVAGIGIAMIVGSVLAWTGSLILRARKSSKGSRVGLAILVVFFIFVIKPEGEDIKSNATGVLDLLAALAAEPKKSREFYPNGQVRESETTTDGEKNGLPVQLSVKLRYYENGEISRETHYTDGVPDGLVRKWYEDGQLREETLFVDGKYHGLTTEWHWNGQKSSESNYVNGSPAGTKTSWYASGQKSSEDIYGTNYSWSTISWYENGQKKNESNIVKSEKDGVQTEWYESGQKSVEEIFVNGQLDGVATMWFENGQKITEGSYVNGWMEGTWIDWDENGRKLSETTYVNGRRAGVETE